MQFHRLAAQIVEVQHNQIIIEFIFRYHHRSIQMLSQIVSPVDMILLSPAKCGKFSKHQQIILE
jgi:hypothetical protein